ncbi:hypothetical protein [Paenibacillus mendelii]|uniref:DUF4349 domain-containing protein n=1 Tax=Paenibacillus mendelii TaxID=206163 RepID=A0ABV6J4X6_9BACL|nr:hypothetical protein [Paenibacillus mendelii]MCQ6560379.1 hypothetical protein [Paenibacillus mendelii]
MRTRMKTAFFIALLVVMPGCQTTIHDKTPQEMLSLTVAGLAAVDRYTFTGTTAIYGADASSAKPITFQGSVEDHNRVQVQSSEMTATANIVHHPYSLLKQIEDTANTTEEIAALSSDRTAVLRIEADQAAARRKWITEMNEAFERSVKDDKTAADGHRRLTVNESSRSDYEQERATEISRLRKQLGEMLHSLEVQTSYRLVVDRKRLLPLKLQEHTVLQYKVEGQSQREERKAELAFITD